MNLPDNLRVNTDYMKKTTSSTAQTSTQGIAAGLLDKTVDAQPEKENNNKNSKSEIIARTAGQIIPSIGKGITSAIDSTVDTLATLANTAAQYDLSKQKTDFRTYNAAKQIEKKYDTAKEKHLLGDKVKNWEQKVDTAQAAIYQDNPDSKLAEYGYKATELAEAAGRMVPTIAVAAATSGIGGAVTGGASLIKGTAEAAAVGKLAEGLGLATMWGDVYTQSTREAESSGSDFVTASKKGFLDATLEVGTELMFGTIAGFKVPGASEGYMSRAVNALADTAGATSLIQKSGIKQAGLTIARIAVKVAETAERYPVLGEALEEMTAEVLSPVIERWTTDPEAPAASLGQIIEAGIGGAILSVAMGGLSNLQMAALGDLDEARRVRYKTNDVDWNIANMRSLANNGPIQGEDIGISEKKMGVQMESKGDRIERSLFGKRSKVIRGIASGVSATDRQKIMNDAIDIAEQVHTPEAVAAAYKVMAEQYMGWADDKVKLASFNSFMDTTRNDLIEQDPKVIAKTKQLRDAETALNNLRERAGLNAEVKAANTSDEASAPTSEEMAQILEDSKNLNEPFNQEAADAVVAELAAKSEAMVTEAEVAEETQGEVKADETEAEAKSDPIAAAEAKVETLRRQLAETKSKAGTRVDRQLRAEDAVERFGQEVVDQFSNYNYIRENATTADGKRGRIVTDINGKPEVMVASEFKEAYKQQHPEATKRQVTKAWNDARDNYQKQIVNELQGRANELNQSFASKNLDLEVVIERNPYKTMAASYISGTANQKPKITFSPEAVSTASGMNYLLSHEFLHYAADGKSNTARTELFESIAQAMNAMGYDFNQLVTYIRSNTNYQRQWDDAIEQLNKAREKKMSAQEINQYKADRATEEAAAHFMSIAFANRDVLQCLALYNPELLSQARASIFDSSVGTIGYAPWDYTRLQILQRIDDAIAAPADKETNAAGLEEAKAAMKLYDFDHAADVNPTDRMFSKVEVAIRKLNDKQWKAAIGGDASSLLRYFKKLGISNEEIEYSGIIPAIQTDLGKDCTRNEAIQYIQDYTKTLKELVLSHDAIPGADPYDVQTEEGTSSIIVGRPRYEKYGLENGNNYREFLYVSPDIDYSAVHWKDFNGVEIHARAQDFVTRLGKRVLFIDEIQSDLHNAAATVGGYFGQNPSSIKVDRSALEKHLENAPVARDHLFYHLNKVISYPSAKKIRDSFDRISEVKVSKIESEKINEYLKPLLDGTSYDCEVSGPIYDSDSSWPLAAYSVLIRKKNGSGSENMTAVVPELQEYGGSLDRYYNIYSVRKANNGNLLYTETDSALDAVDESIIAVSKALLNNSKDGFYEEVESDLLDYYKKIAPPDVPYKNNSYEYYVFQRLLDRAAREKYDYIAWTTGKMQEDRWSDKFKEGYRIEYDQDLPSFAKRYGAQWGADVEKINLYSSPPKKLFSKSSMNLMDWFYNNSRQVPDSSGRRWQDTEEANKFLNSLRSVLSEEDQDYIREKVFARSSEVYGDPFGMFYELPLAIISPENRLLYLYTLNLWREERSNILSDEQYPVANGVWALPITDSMRETLEEYGQPRWASNSLDANNLEGLTIEEIENYYELKERYGGHNYTTMKDGTYTVRENEGGIPRQINSHVATSRYLDRLLTSDEIDVPASMQARMIQSLLRGIEGTIGVNHVIMTDQDAVDYARERMDRHTERDKNGKEHTVQNKTLSDAYNDAMNTFDGKHMVNKYDLAFGQQLILEYAQRLREIEEGTAGPVDSKDTTELLDQTERLIAAVCSAGSRAGQNLQAMGLLKKLTPQGRLYYIQSQMNEIISSIVDRKGNVRIGGYRYLRDSKGNYQRFTNLEGGGTRLEALVIPEDMQKKMLECYAIEDPQERIAAMEEIEENEIIPWIAEQIPLTITDRVTAWRYLAMLGNPRTHIRNIVSNAAMGAAVKVKNAIAANIEDIWLKDKVSGRTKTSKRNVDPELWESYKKFADTDWENDKAVKDITLTGGKVGFQSRINDARKKLGFQIGDTKVEALDKLSKGNTYLLELEDEKAAKRAYKEAFANYCAANKLSLATLNANTTDSNVKLAQARSYAINEAAKATYHDASFIAAKLNEVQKQYGVVGELIIGGMFPFKKTPINILKRGIEYSPIGLISGINKAYKSFDELSFWDEMQEAQLADRRAEILQAAQEAGIDMNDKVAVREFGVQYEAEHPAAVNRGGHLTGEYSAISAEDALNNDLAEARMSAQAKATKGCADAIDMMASGMTGTMIMMLGMLLAHWGLLKAGGSDNDREEYYDQMLGYQKYSGTLFGKNVTLDWITPLSMLVFTGAQLVEITQGTVDFYDLIDAVGRIPDPLMNLSLLQGFNEALSSYDSGLGKIAFSAVESFGGQFIPTFAGQVARTIDNKRRTTYVAKEGETILGQDLGKFVNKMENKIPFLSMRNPAYVDMWGREEVNDHNIIVRFIENAVSPAYIKDINQTAIDDKVLQLHAETGDRSVIPTLPSSTYTQDGQKYYQTSTEYKSSKDIAGAINRMGLESLTGMPWYEALPFEDQADYVGKVYDFAKAIAKYDYFDSKGISYKPNSTYLKIVDAVNNGMTIGEAIYAYYTAYNISADKNEKGNSIRGSKKQKVYDFFVSLGLTKEQMNALGVENYVF